MSAPFTFAAKNAFACTFVKSKPVHKTPSFCTASFQQSSSAVPVFPLHGTSASDGELNCTISMSVLKIGEPLLDAVRGSTRSKCASGNALDVRATSAMTRRTKSVASARFSITIA